MASRASAKLVRVLKSDASTFERDWHQLCDRRNENADSVDKAVKKIIGEEMKGPRELRLWMEAHSKELRELGIDVPRSPRIL